METEAAAAIAPGAVPEMPRSAPPRVPAEFGGDPLQSPQALTLREFLARGRATGRKKVTPATRVAMLSIAGGTGKTTLTALLARCLASRARSVVLADFSWHNCMQEFFGLPEAFGPVFFPTSGAGIAPTPVLSLYREGKRLEDFGTWFDLISRSAEIVFLDGMEDPVATGLEVLRENGMVLIPIAPDVASLVSVTRLDAILRETHSARFYYLLNRFDPEQQRHIEIREMLREMLGDRLLPFSIVEQPSIQDVAVGLTPFARAAREAPVFAQIAALAEWVETVALGREVQREAERSAEPGRGQ